MSSKLLEWQLKQFNLDPQKKGSKFYKKQSQSVQSQLAREKEEEIERFQRNLQTLVKKPDENLAKIQTDVFEMMQDVTE